MALIRANRLLDRYLSEAEDDRVRLTTHLDSLTINSGNRDLGVEYTPTPLLAARMIHRLVPGPLQDWNFIDIGAGRGRVLTQAARHPYRLVVGVEFANELVDEARANVRAIPEEAIRARSVQVVRADATEHTFPVGNNLFFLFNPFGQGVVRDFAENLKRTRCQNRARLIYLNAVHRSVFETDTDFRSVPVTGWHGQALKALAPFRLRIYDWGA